MFERAVCAAAAPDIALVDVVVVGDENGGAVAHEIAEGPADDVPLAEVVGGGGLDGEALDAVAGDVFVDLVTGEEEEVGVVVEEVVDGGDIGEAGVLVAGEAGDDEIGLVDGVAADGAFPEVGDGFTGGGDEGIDEAVADIAGVVPTGDAEGGGAGEGVDDFLVDGLPVAVFVDLELDGGGVLDAEGRHLGGHFEDAVGEGVLGPEDGAEGVVGVMLDAGTVEGPVIEPEGDVAAPGRRERGEVLAVPVGDDGDVAGEAFGGEGDGDGPGAAVGGAIAGGESEGDAAGGRGGGEGEFDIVEGDAGIAGAGGGGVLLGAEEEFAGGGDAGVEASAVDGCEAVVVDGAGDAEAEAGPAWGEGLGGVEGAEADGGGEGGVVVGELVGEDLDVAVGAADETFEAAAGDAPVLKRIGPVFGADPGAGGVGDEIAGKTGAGEEGGRAGEKQEGERGGGERGHGALHHFTRLACRGVRGGGWRGRGGGSSRDRGGRRDRRRWGSRCRSSSLHPSGHWVSGGR